MLEYFFQLKLAQKTSLIASALSAVACTVIVLASYQGSRQLVQHSAALFGESLIRQLSREASNPLVQDDKLSLQALLNELVSSPIVNHGVIYDVENQLITEAGQAEDGLSLSASITFQDSIAGYTVITLNAKSLQQQTLSLAWQLTALSALLLVLIYMLSSLPAQYVSALLKDLKVIAAKSSRAPKLKIAYRGRDELQQLAEQIIQGPQQQNLTAPANDAEHAILSLEITNLPQLRQTMSRRNVRELVTECYKQLTVICKLYDGQITLRAANHFTVQFLPTDSEDSFPFRALCSGFLIQQWMAGSHSPMTLAIGLSFKEKSVGEALENEIAMQEAIDEAKHAGRCGNGHMVATAAVAVHHSVSQRVSTQAVNAQTIDRQAQHLQSLQPQTLNQQAHNQQAQNNEDRSLRIIKNLTNPYNELLARQLSTLSAQVT